MKKRFWLAVLLLLLPLVVAGPVVPEEKLIERYSDFPLDNIHILRLQEAARSLGTNVSLMRDDLNMYQTQQTRDVSELRVSLGLLDNSVKSQLAGLQNSIDRIDSDMQVLKGSDIEIKASSLPSYVILLLVLNSILLLILIALIFWLKEDRKTAAKVHDDKYTHVPKALVSYVRSQLKKKKNLHNLKLELVGKGWTTSAIDHAVEIVKEDK